MPSLTHVLLTKTKTKTKTHSYKQEFLLLQHVVWFLFLHQNKTFNIPADDMFEAKERNDEEMRNGWQKQEGWQWMVQNLISTNFHIKRSNKEPFQPFNRTVILLDFWWVFAGCLQFQKYQAWSHLKHLMSKWCHLKFKFLHWMLCQIFVRSYVNFSLSFSTLILADFYMGCLNCKHLANIWKTSCKIISVRCL